MSLYVTRNGSENSIITPMVEVWIEKRVLKWLNYIVIRNGLEKIEILSLQQF